MYADINKISYITADNKYSIVTEFSRLPIEAFNTEQQAKDFIKGYLTADNQNKWMELGKTFRKFVEMDISSGVKYRKVIDVKELQLV